MSNARRFRRTIIEPVSAHGRVEPDEDGPFKGQVNAYRCDDCGGNTVTIDRDAGVTPMFLGCRADGTESGCGGRAVSMGYPKGPRPSWAVPAWEWYAPSDREAKAMGREMYDHIKRGGLALRKIEAATDGS